MTESELHSSRIELSGENLRSNIDFMQQLIGRERKLSFVVKGNAYGHGIREWSPWRRKRE